MKDKIAKWVHDNVSGNDILNAIENGDKYHLIDLINDCLQDIATKDYEALEYEDWQEAKDLLVEAGFTVIPPK
jgi:hypothetical protein